MSKIKKITVSNLKAVSKMTADFNGCTAIITGGNNKGKTSFLKSLPERVRGVKPDLIVKKGETEGFAEWELTTGEKFVWSFDTKSKSGEKLTFITEKNIKTSVTKDIANTYFPKVFDVDEFLESAPAKQKIALQKLTGIDFSELDKLILSAREDRTFRNRQLQTEQAKGEYVDPKLQAEEIPTADMEQELSGIDAHNRQFKSIEDGIQEKARSIEQNESDIKDLEQRIKELQDRNEKLSDDVKKGNAWTSVDKNKPKSKEAIDLLKKNLQDAKDMNEEIKANNKNREQVKEIEKAKTFAEESDAEVKRLEAEKLDVIKNSSMPDGFGFSDDGITYLGYAFTKEQLSSSGIYIAALKLAAIGLGEVKTLHFDASFLDKNSLLDIEKWANENDLQLLIERPDFEGGEIEYELIDISEKAAIA
jgi:hypothetical protein